ncbi:hypothetical protein [Actinomadura sp. K4S16]|nr:hypothetical protein [Actinomadura sp. K4S16]
MEATQRNFVILEVDVDRDYLPDDSDRGRDERRDRREPDRRRPGNAVVTLTLEGTGSVPEFAAVLSEVEDVVGVTLGADQDDDSE